ncbi:MAG: RsiV family protein [Oscillospiraceae bacterium]
MDTIYKIICNNDTMISIRFYTVINLGGSTEVNRIFTLDKKSGKVLTLENLFIEGSDYIKIISNDILKQMKIQVDAELADYFIPGGFWPNDECFKEIDTTQNFYINSDGKLVIVFDEYVVAPGSMGSPEFIISTDILKNILTNPSLIK